MNISIREKANRGTRLNATSIIKKVDLLTKCLNNTWSIDQLIKKRHLKNLPLYAF